MKWPRQILGTSTDALLSVLFPATCLLCRMPVESFRLGLVCGPCWSRVTPFNGQLCERCGYLFAASHPELERALCGACRRNLYPFDTARSYGSFEDPLREIIHQFKYHSHWGLARPLARLLAQAYETHRRVLHSDLAVPVPLHRARRRERGFNQALELASLLGKFCCLPVSSTTLIRHRPTRVQAGLSRRERRLNLKGAFSLTDPLAIRDRVVLLVDDVFTTGATVSECARILKGAGASRVNVLTIARVVP
ncbi:MAG: ComF family protein [Acidobacteriota bacterium]